MTDAAATLILGRTTHARLKPFERRFSYALAMVEMDVDRLDEAGRQSALFAIDGAAPFAFHRADHGERRKGGSLRAWAEQRFAQANVDVTGAEIRLAAFPRVLGFGFSPISLWTARTPAGALIGVLYEVHNTFGEAHTYVQAAPLGGTAEKELFVSPFMNVEGEYGFTLNTEGDRVSLTVQNRVASETTHVATLVGRRVPLTSRSIASALARLPMSGLGVMTAIHWQALKLWLRGARFRGKTPKRAHSTTLVFSQQSEQAPLTRRA
jgi:DUF1365 family protein